MCSVADIAVPAAIRERAEVELFPGEKVLWAGKPGATRLHTFDVVTQVGWVLFLVGLHLSVSARHLWLIPVFVFFTLYGLWMLLYPVWIRYGRARMLCLVTNRRAIRIYPWFWGGTRAESYGLSLLSRTFIRRHNRRTDRGDVVLGYRRMAMGSYTRFYGRYPLGFMNIEHPQAVADLILKECRRVLQETDFRLPVPKDDPQSDLTEEQDKLLYGALEPGEFVRYAARAYRGFDLRDPYLLIAYLFTCAGAVCVLYLIWQHNGGNTKWLWCGIFGFTALWSAAGFIMHFQELQMRPLLFYAVTTHRAMALHPRHGIIKSFALRPSMMQEHSIRPNGSGQLTLGYHDLTPYHITRRDREGFMHLNNVRAMEQALSEVDR